MSSVLPRAPRETPEGVLRYQTRFKIRIDSHNSGPDKDPSPILIFDDIVSCSTNKHIKSAGTANVSLVASQNWLNLIFPNDYINIYVNQDDGEGWTRLFFGLVDRIEELYEVDSEGRPSTRYFIVASDFQKIFDRTDIYFNPHVFKRSDVVSADVNRINIGGIALATKGVEAHGSCADIVQNLILITLGFASQFVLPPSYSPGRLQNISRKRRNDYVIGNLSQVAQAAIQAAGGSIADLREQFVAETTATLTEDLSNEGTLEEAIIDSLASDTAEAIADQRIKELIATSDTSQYIDDNAAIQGSLSILSATDPTAPSTVLDVIDMFTFVERRAMDGYAAGAPVWQEQGAIISIMRSLSNETINELFFDLRPLSQEYGGGISPEPVQGIYAREPDDTGENVGDGVSGITYVPSVVMREYPFSTIDGLDLRNVNLNLSNEGRLQDENVGLVPFGPIFSSGKNEPGRHVVPITNINVEDRILEQATRQGIKHLDVAVVSDREIMKTQLGRSDADHFNLFEFYTQAVLGQDQRYYMNDLLPLITPIHVMRHGLRVLSVTTRSANYGPETIVHVRKPQAPPEEDTPEDVAEAIEAEEIVQPVPQGDLQAPCLSSEGARHRNVPGVSWGYRRGRAEEQAWVFHQGIDILAPRGTPVYAIADGEVVVSAPLNVHTGLGNVVVLRHEFTGVSGPRYSIYAHLNERAVGWNLDQKEGPKGARRLYAASNAPGIGGAGGAHDPIPVKKGTVIGFVGNTGVQNKSGPHLHFELGGTFPINRATPATPKVPYTDSSSRPPVPADFDPTGVSLGAGQLSCDPVRFFSALGVDLLSAIDGAVEESETEETDGPDEDDNSAENENTPKEDTDAPDIAEAPQKTVVSGAIDTAVTRSQLIRWALLQDHWYQHNIEYLSGSIQMRFAPEIRVGYRLDLRDREMSFYVEGVTHSWQYPEKAITSLQVTRGQPNNPFPLYVLPKIESLNPTDNQRRTKESRLATYFLTPDPLAVRRAVILRKNQSRTYLNSLAAGQETANVVDQTEIENGLSTKYNEVVVGENSRDVTRVLEEEKLKNGDLIGDFNLSNPLAGRIV